MNVGLDVRVIDQIGLANPLAQHTERLKHGRIGHDKNLFPDWVVADGPWVKVYPGIPDYLDQQWVARGGGGAAMPRDRGGAELGARADELCTGSSPTCVHSFEFTQYRIDRVPLFELVRCGLDVPDGESCRRLASEEGGRRCGPRRPTIDDFGKIRSNARPARPAAAPDIDSNITFAASPARATGRHMRKRRFPAAVSPENRARIDRRMTASAARSRRADARSCG